MELDNRCCPSCYFSNTRIEEERRRDTIYHCRNCDYVWVEPLEEELFLHTYFCPTQYCFDNNPRRYSKLGLQYHLMDSHNIISILRDFTELYVKFVEQVNTIDALGLVDDDVSNTSEMGKR
ncbi:MAG: hypothetical protein EX285_03025 [Thaumarchaeota archaeon]|nr:hypothetical protein [Nitrososphaerota archaeon]